MNIFDSFYYFKPIDYTELPFEYTVRVTAEAFIMLNQTDATVQCVLKEVRTGRELVLSEMPSGMGYTNSKMDFIRFQIPQGTILTVKVIGPAPTSGKFYLTLTQ